MNPLERLVSFVAPHLCISCGSEGSLLCESCRLSGLPSLPSRCYRCHQATKQSRTCRNCRRTTSITHAWVVSEYQGAAKELIHKLKFERAKAAAGVIAALLDECLPLLPGDITVAHIPTAQKRIRIRGYDQAYLIAVQLARRRGWRHKTLLDRHGSLRQVGATRQLRLRQLEGVFVSRTERHGTISPHVLLVDDVLTTGATIEAATKTLKAGGVKTIDVAVFAQP